MGGSGSERLSGMIGSLYGEPLLHGEFPDDVMGNPYYYIIIDSGESPDDVMGNPHYDIIIDNGGILTMMS